MTLIAHTDLPTFAELRRQGHDVLSPDRAEKQDIRELHIGFLNMMPDAALQATERQFIRLVGSCNRIAQFYVYPFSLPALERSAETCEYIERYYSDFDELRIQGLDALIITGANVANPHLNQEKFWTPLLDVVNWAQENVASMLCSCLATHALLKRFHGIDRRPLPAKRWGVYSHRVCDEGHPLMRDVNTKFDVPHSRFNDISRQQLEDAGLRVLAESDEGGVHMAVSSDQIRIVYFQGHPEYDYNSLLKEYKREIRRYQSGARDALPPFPENYFPSRVWNRIESSYSNADALIDILDNEVDTELANTWGDTAKSIVNNWLGLVYQLTNLDRTKQFMAGIDPENPLSRN